MPRKKKQDGLNQGSAESTDNVISIMTAPVAEQDADTTTRKIKKAKMIGGLTLDVEYDEKHTLIKNKGTKRIDIGGSISRKGDNAVHDDLKNAFAKLVPHLAMIGELSDFNDDEVRRVIERGQHESYFEEFHVTGFTTNGDGVTLIGQKDLKSGKVLNITTPFTKLDGSDYRFTDELSEALQSCEYEVQEYLNGKMAPPAQTELEFTEVEEEN